LYVIYILKGATTHPTDSKPLVPSTTCKYWWCSSVQFTCNSRWYCRSILSRKTSHSLTWHDACFVLLWWNKKP